jgi:hypothetical protein
MIQIYCDLGCDFNAILIFCIVWYGIIRDNRIVIYVFDIANCIILYNKVWLHVSINYMVILRTLMHIKPKLQLQISFWVKMRSQSVNNAYKLNLKVVYKRI